MSKDAYLALIHREMGNWWKNASEDERDDFGTYENFIARNTENWSVPRDSKKRKLVVKWVAPTYVRRQQGADITTVFTVKQNNLTAYKSRGYFLCFLLGGIKMATKKSTGNSLISMKEAKRLANIKSKKMHELTLAMVYNVLLDKFGFDQKKLQDLYLSVAKLSIEIQEHRIKPQDLLDTLAEEYSIDLEKEYHDGMLWRK